MKRDIETGSDSEILYVDNLCSDEESENGQEIVNNILDMQKYNKENSDHSEQGNETML